MPATTVDVSGAARRSKATKDLAAHIQDRIGKRAIVTLQRRLGPELTRELSSVLNLAKSDISKRTSVTAGDNYVRVFASGKRIPLSRFGGKWRGRQTPGATAQIWRGGATKTYVGAFALAAGAIVSRALKGAKRVARLPLTNLFGPDVGSVMVSHSAHGIKNQLDEFAQATLEAELTRLTAVEMEKI